MKKLARLWDSLENKKVQCHVCANECIIKSGRVGICRTRKNFDGELYTLIYGSLSSPGGLDPIEKKPLYNFWPGEMSYSIASIGCSFKCLHCQNWNISQACPDDTGTKGSFDFEDFIQSDIPLLEITPEELTENVIKSGAKTVAYTYNEPLIWHEWLVDTIPLLKKEGIQTILVTNGFSTHEASKELVKAGIDAANIDIKGITDDFYKKICKVQSVQPVLDTSSFFKKKGVHIEITNLIIPDLNDSKEEIEKLCEWVLNNLGRNTPLHFSAYHPDYKIPSDKRTPQETLDMAYHIAKDIGLYFPYVGNIIHAEGSNTYCPSCRNLIIGRLGFNISKLNVKNDKKCPKCDYNFQMDIVGDIKSP